MWNNRNNNGYGNEPAANGISGHHALIALIVLNTICYLFPLDKDVLALTVGGVQDGDVWRLVTAMFLHGDFFHLFFNMFSLFIFGSLIAPLIGAVRFLVLYFVSGIAGNLLGLWLSWKAGDAALLGASGAVMGVIMASAMIMPDVKMLLLFIPFPIKLRTLALVFIGIELFNQVSVGVFSNVAYLVHIGGFSGGYLMMRFAYRRFVQWDPVEILLQKAGMSSAASSSSSTHRRPASPPSGWTVRNADYAPPPPPPSGRVSQQELDTLLDKVSAGGINSLTEAELVRLRQAREQMRGGRN